MKPADKRSFRAQAHSLKPVILIGQAGLSPGVLAETKTALDTHELIKVKIRAEKVERKVIYEKLCRETGAELIQAIGQMAVLYRPNPNKQNALAQKAP